MEIGVYYYLTIDEVIDALRDYMKKKGQILPLAGSDYEVDTFNRSIGITLRQYVVGENNG